MSFIAALAWLLDRYRCQRSTRTDARDEPAATPGHWEPVAQCHLEWTWDEQPQPIPPLPASHRPSWAHDVVPPEPTQLEIAKTASPAYIKAEFRHIVQAQTNRRGEWRA